MIQLNFLIISKMALILQMTTTKILLKILMIFLWVLALQRDLVPVDKATTTCLKF